MGTLCFHWILKRWNCKWDLFLPVNIYLYKNNVIRTKISWLKQSCAKSHNKTNIDQLPKENCYSNAIGSQLKPNKHSLSARFFWFMQRWQKMLEQRKNWHHKIAFCLLWYQDLVIHTANLLMQRIVLNFLFHEVSVLTTTENTITYHNTLCWSL